MTHITDATVWIVSTRGMADASAANEFGYTTGAHEALMVKVEDYEAARAEVARLDHVNKLAYQHYEELTAALAEANGEREEMARHYMPAALSLRIMAVLNTGYLPELLEDFKTWRRASDALTQEKRGG